MGASCCVVKVENSECQKLTSAKSNVAIVIPDKVTEELASPLTPVKFLSDQETLAGSSPGQERGTNSPNEPKLPFLNGLELETKNYPQSTDGTTEHKPKGLDDSSYSLDVDEALIRIQFDCIDADRDGKISTADLLRGLSLVHDELDQDEGSKQRLNSHLEELILSYSPTRRGYWTIEDFARFMHDSATTKTQKKGSL